MKLRIIPVVALAALLLAACAGPGTETVAKAGGGEHLAGETKALDGAAFHDAMRKLWEDHVTWTRLYIVSAAADLPDAEATAGRLLRNQDDIGAAIAPFYGHQAASELTTLLREHILIAADILRAAKAGQDRAVEAAGKVWYANGDEIASFLAAANPEHWPEEALRHHMKTHLDLTLAEAVARLQGDFAKDIALYDEVHDAILEMADALSDGIRAQFPERFA